MQLMDEQLVAHRAIEGDPDAIRRLWRAHRRWVAAVLLAHLPRGAELDDALQDVAMTVVRKIHTLEDPGRLRPWLRSVALNAARTEGRRRTRRLRLARPRDGVSLDALEDPAADRSDQREEAERLLRLARDLPREYAEPLILRCCQEMSYRQIADLLDLPVTTVETRIARARRMLRETAAGAAPSSERSETAD